MKNKEFKLAICISGGLDSYTAIHYAKDIFCPKMGWDFKKDVILIEIYDTENPYGFKETHIVDKLYRNGEGMPYVHKVELRGYSSLVATDTHVVLGRNAMIASIAAGVAPLVWINGTSFENNPGMFDKNRMFFSQMTHTLSHACNYTRTKITVIMSPFQGNCYADGNSDIFVFPEWEKHDMILWLEECGYTSWKETTSCFDPDDMRCGRCTVCGKRFIYEAYAERKIHYSFFDKPLEETFFSSPLTNETLILTLDKMLDAVVKKDFSRYDKKRIEIYAEIMSSYGNSTAGKINSLLNEEGV